MFDDKNGETYAVTRELAGFNRLSTSLNWLIKPADNALMTQHGFPNCFRGRSLNVSPVYNTVKATDFVAKGFLYEIHVPITEYFVFPMGVFDHDWKNTHLCSKYTS